MMTTMKAARMATLTLPLSSADAPRSQNLTSMMRRAHTAKHLPRRKRQRLLPLWPPLAAARAALELKSPRQLSKCQLCPATAAFPLFVACVQRCFFRRAFWLLLRAEALWKYLSTSNWGPSYEMAETLDSKIPLLEGLWGICWSTLLRSASFIFEE